MGDIMHGFLGQKRESLGLHMQNLMIFKAYWDIEQTSIARGFAIGNYLFPMNLGRAHKLTRFLKAPVFSKIFHGRFENVLASVVMCIISERADKSSFMLPTT